MERRIETVISAVDEYSAVMNRYNNALGQTEGAIASAGQASNKLSRQLDGLTSGLDWAAGGVKKFKNMLEGMAFGGVIGLAAGGVSAFTQMLIEAYQSAGMASDKLSTLNSELVQQATSWKMLVPPIKGATEAEVEYYNARLKRAQFEGIQRKKDIDEEIRSHEQLQKNYEINARAFPQRTELTASALEHGEAITKLRLELASLNTVAALTESSVNKVQAALASGQKGKTPAITKIEDFTGSAFSEGVFSSLFIGALDMPKEELALTRVFGEVLSNAVASAAESAKLAMPKIDLFAGLVTDSGDNTEYFAWLDEKHRYEMEIEEMNLNGRLAYADQEIAAERNLHNTIMSMKFGAANQSIALLALVGQKSKALQMAALVAQKALAIAQVFIQTQTAASAALAPPPLGLGPLLGIPLAASVQLWGNIQMGLIAATGLAQAAMGGGGSPASMSGIGGGGGVGALPIAPPSLMASETKSTQHITISIHALDPSSINWDNMMENNIKPAMERLSGPNGSNVALDIQVVRR